MHARQQLCLLGSTSHREAPQSSPGVPDPPPPAPAAPGVCVWLLVVLTSAACLPRPPGCPGLASGLHCGLSQFLALNASRWKHQHDPRVPGRTPKVCLESEAGELSIVTTEDSLPASSRMVLTQGRENCRGRAGVGKGMVCEARGEEASSQRPKPGQGPKARLSSASLSPAPARGPRLGEGGRVGVGLSTLWHPLLP